MVARAGDHGAGHVGGAGAHAQHPEMKCNVWH